MVKKKKKNLMKNKDRISDLPDALLLHILSFLNIKQAIHTCILSPRWKNLWKYIPTLTLTSSQFTTVEIFTKFVTRILSLRDISTDLHTLRFHPSNVMKPRLLETILNYAVSHKVQQLDVKVTCDIQYFPTCLLSCRTLTSLDLSFSHPIVYNTTILFPISLNLPLLTRLDLSHFSFRAGNDGCVDPFLAFTNLKSLKIVNCKVAGAQNLCISSIKLLNLDIYMRHYVRETYFGIKLYAPSLCNFNFSGIPVQKLCWDKSNLSSIKQVSIDIIQFCISKGASLVLIKWLNELANMESLTISSTALKVLSLVPNLSVELRSLCNLKSLRIEKKEISWIPDKIVEVLIQNSPSPQLNIVPAKRGGKVAAVCTSTKAALEKAVDSVANKIKDV
ncbi:F-box/FBD/LRR-repeat protein At1g16930-like [Vicia villosa]|uniref:F-box/FBD/LRR-repeat protein At1g16930-like n=1 Tax=Vicia villosa TaxID=3911 RepID=UPI00273AAB39|nr:F-box/FBD/LRR-repeat protein At1g16930-like [Vicia villosa]